MLHNDIPVIIVSKILGHSTPSVTFDIYRHLNIEIQGEASQPMDGLVSPLKVNLPIQIPEETSADKNKKYNCTNSHHKKT